jgi:hypothetical protein
VNAKDLLARLVDLEDETVELAEKVVVTIAQVRARLAMFEAVADAQHWADGTVDR